MSYISDTSLAPLLTSPDDVGGFAGDELAHADRALLSVHHLIAVLRNGPVHGVERKVLADGVDDLIALLLA